jgi:hypothetical protein
MSSKSHHAKEFIEVVDPFVDENIQKRQCSYPKGRLIINN